MAKRVTPDTKIRRRPKRSPVEPPTRMSAPRKRPYDSTTHCTSMTVALKLACRAGRATLTTVLSMNAMLLPRMVAARIHGSAFDAQGVSVDAERRTASSQGGFMQQLRMRWPWGRFRNVYGLNG